MRTETFDFAGADGQRLSGRLDLPDGAIEAHALFAHCFTCTKASVAATRIARALAARGVAVLRFDFTGLGESEGDFADSTFSGTVRDLVAAGRAMADAGRTPSLLVGHSLGGAAALAAAGELAEIRAVATVAAPFDVAHVEALLGDQAQRLRAEGEAEVRIGERPFQLRRAFLDDLAGHDQAVRIKALKRPLLVLHGPRDAVVGVENASQIFLAARHPKSFVSLDDADHMLTRAADAEYAAEVIAAWASRYLGRVAPVRSAGQTGRVVVEETGEGRYQVEVTAGEARFLADEPQEVGGLGSGPTPYDLLSAGLGACTAMTLRMYAERKAWPLAKVRVSVGHARDASRAPPDVFSREVALDGDLDAEQRTRLMEIADRCPVHRTLSGGAAIETRDAPHGGELPDVEHPDQHARDMAADAAAEPEA